MRKPKSEQAEKVLERMKETRKIDSENLRSKIEIRLKELEVEKVKGQEVLNKYYANIEEVQKQMLRINGAMVVLKQIIEPKNIEEPKPKEEIKKEN